MPLVSCIDQCNIPSLTSSYCSSPYTRFLTNQHPIPTSLVTCHHFLLTVKVWDPHATRIQHTHTQPQMATKLHAQMSVHAHRTRERSLKLCEIGYLHLLPLSPVWRDKHHPSVNNQMASQINPVIRRTLSHSPP